MENMGSLILTSRILGASAESTRAQVAGPFQEIRLFWRLAIVSIVLALVFNLVAGVRFVHPEALLYSHGPYLLSILVIRVWALFVVPRAERLRSFVDVVFAFWLIAVSFSVMQYAAIAMPGIAATAWIVRLDAGLGFEWLPYATFVDNIPLLSQALTFAYNEWIAEITVATGLLIYFGQFDELRAFALAFFLAYFAAFLLLCFFDIRAPDLPLSYAQTGLHWPEGIGHGVNQIVGDFRTATNAKLDFRNVFGMICFPSIHVVAALLIAVATRRLPYLWAPFLIFSIAVMQSAITDGGHYYMDVIAGCVWATGATAIAQPLSRRLR